MQWDMISVSQFALHVCIFTYYVCVSVCMDVYLLVYGYNLHLCGRVYTNMCSNLNLQIYIQFLRNLFN